MENPGISLKIKNFESLLIDGLVILTAFFSDKLNFWQILERLNFPKSVSEVQYNQVSGLVWLYVLVAVLTILYAGARKSIPQNQFMQFIYGLGLIGVLFLFPGLIALAFNSIIIGLPALFIAYVLLMKQNSFLGLANKLYDHKSRIIVLPVLTSLFISGAEYLLKTRIDIDYAIVCIIMLYMPIRLLMVFKEPYKFYQLLAIMVTMVYFSYQTFINIRNSPTSPIWNTCSGYLGDKVQIVKQTEDKAVIFSLINDQNSVYIVSKKNNNRWEIDTLLTNQFEEKYHGNFSKWP